MARSKPAGTRDDNVKAKADGRQIAQKYAMSWAIINADPGMKAWFDGFAAKYVAANGNISQEQFNLELEQQEWWKKHSATFIKDYQQSLEDPVGYEQSLASDIENMRAVAQSMGAQVDDSVIREMAVNARRFGWNQQQTQNALAMHVQAVEGDFKGAAGGVQDELMKWAKANGLTLSPQLVESYISKAATGETNIDEIKSDIRKTYMAGSYPGWQDKINAGFDIADLAAPYVQSAQSLLEDSNVGLDDPVVKRIMQATDANGQPRVMPLYEAEKLLRSDPRWQTTDNAYQTYAGVAHHVLRTWGFE